MPLYVKLLNEDAKVPTVANPGEDLAYDLYATKDVELPPFRAVKVPIGISACFHEELDGHIILKHALIVKDRSSMAASNITTSAGVIDWGYRGEIVVLLTNNLPTTQYVTKGQKVAQMYPTIIETLFGASVVAELPESERMVAGWGSTGK